MSITVFDEKCLVILVFLSNTRHVMCVVVPIATQWIYSSHSYPIHPLSLIQPILFHAKLLDIRLFMTAIHAEWTKPRGKIMNHVDHSPFLSAFSALTRSAIPHTTLLLNFHRCLSSHTHPCVTSDRSLDPCTLHDLCV